MNSEARRIRFWNDLADPRHGTVNGYVNLRCKCEPCTKAHTEDRRIRREKRRGAVPDSVHGTDSGYTNWLCRCDPCVEARRERKRLYARGFRTVA